MKCKRCSSERIVKNGFNRLKSGKKKQKYLCKDCNLTFHNSYSILGFRKKKRLIAKGVDLYNDGLSFYKISYRLKVSASTVYNWIMRLPKLLNKKLEEIIKSLKLSSTRHMDISELVLRKKKKWNNLIKGYEMVQNKAHIHAMQDNTSKFLTCFQLFSDKSKESSMKFFKIAFKHPRPSYIITDDSDSFKEPIDKIFNKGPKNIKKEKVKHIAITKSDPKYKEFKGVNNLIERFFMTAKSRTKITFRYRKIESVKNIIFMFILNYNFLKPNRTIGKTPADFLGIGLNKKRMSFFDLMVAWNIR